MSNDVEKSVSREQVGKAVDALLQYIGKKSEKSTSLIEDEDFLYLVCSKTICHASLQSVILESPHSKPNWI